MTQLKNKNIIVTGATKGIGREIARRLAFAGANIMLIARDAKALKQLSAELQNTYNVNTLFFPGDVSEAKTANSAVKMAMQKWGSLDGLIANAGYARPGYFHELPQEEFLQALKVDYLGSVWFVKAILPHLKQGSFISLTSSVVGYMGVFGYTSYSAAKFAIMGFAESLQQELYERKIQVSVLCPPDTETPGYSLENKTKPFETKELSKSAKLMKPEEVARIFLNKLNSGKFIITCNFESWLFYRLHGILPGLTRFIMKIMINSAAKKRRK